MRTSHALLFALCIVFLGFLCCTTAMAAEKPIVIRLGHIQSADQAHHQGSMKFAEIMSKKTNDRIQVKVFPASQLGTATSQFANVKMGTQEMFVEAGPVASRLEPDYLALLVPFLIKDHEHAKKVFCGAIGAEIADKLLKKQGIRVVANCWDRATRHLLTKAQITKLADLKGLKIRVPANPIFLKSWKALGTSPTSMEFAEIYLALQQGTIDGVELPLDLIYTQKYHEIVKNCTLTYHIFEKASVFVNEKFFQTLSSGDQKLIQDALVEAGIYQNSILAEQYKTLSDQMKKAGVIFTDLPDPERKRAAATIEKVAEEEEAAGKWTKGLISRIREAQ